MVKKLLAVFLVILVLCGCSSKKQQWQEQYDLGMRYLSEGNYQEAILAFSAAIEIDPNQADAYVLRGDAYVMAAKAEPDKADKYLRKARKDYEKAEDLNPELEEELKDKREELEELQAQLDGKQPPTKIPVDIPPEAFVFDDHSYYIYDCTTSWEEAQAFCEAMGGSLAVITSQEENDALYAYMISTGCQSAYFGLSDSSQEGIWVWVSGEESDYRNWAAGEPNKQNSGENYAMFYYKYSDGTWNDGDFGGSTQNGGTNFLCEWETVPKETFSEKNDNREQKQQYSYDAFLEEQAYRAYWLFDSNPPAYYALLDMNRDAADELIVVSESDYGFVAYQVYYFDLATGEILLADIQGANPGMCYGNLSYSEMYHALVMSPLNMGSMGYFREYHVFEGAGFVYAGSVGVAEGGYFSELSGADQTISLEEYENLRGEAVEIRLLQLP